MNVTKSEHNTLRESSHCVFHLIAFAIMYSALQGFLLLNISTQSYLPERQKMLIESQWSHFARVTCHPEHRILVTCILHILYILCNSDNGEVCLLVTRFPCLLHVYILCVTCCCISPALIMQFNGLDFDSHSHLRGVSLLFWVFACFALYGCTQRNFRLSFTF